MNEHGELPVATKRSNYLKGVLNGTIFTLGEAASNPGLVLTLLVRQLGGSLTLISLLPVIQSTGYLLPQLIVGGHVQALPYKLPTYRLFALLRLIAQFTLIIACYVAEMVDPTIALTGILVSYALFCIGGGVTTLSFQDVVAKIVQPNQRGRFFGLRQLSGGLLAFAVGGTFVRWMLSDSSPIAFPMNFAAISLFSFVCYATAMGIFATVKEPIANQTVPALRLRDALKAAPDMLRGHPNYRRFIWARLCLLVGRLAEPFYIIYVTEQLGFPKSTAGLFIAIAAVTAAISNVLWGRLGDKRGMHWLLRLTGSLSVAPPLMMLVAPLLVPFGSTVVLAWLLLLCLMSGVSSDGIGIAGMTYLLEVVPGPQRPIYMGLANTILGVGALVPVVGGILVNTVGYAGTYIVAALFCIVGVVIATQLQATPRPTEV